jgi:cytochrome P450
MTMKNPIDDIPQAPGGLPVLGHTVGVLRDPFAVLDRLPAVTSGLLRLDVGPAKVVVVSRPDLADKVLRDDRTFDKGGPLFETARDLLGNGLGTCPHRDHRRLRRLSQPAFHHARLPGYARVMSDRIAARVDSWDDGQILDVLPEMMSLSSDILIGTMLSRNLSTRELGQLNDDLAAMVAGIYRRMVLPAAVARLPTPGSLRYRRAKRRLRNMVITLVAERSATGGGGDDLLAALLAARDNQGTGTGARATLTQSELVDQIVTHLAAGGETTANALTWALDLLARHPAVQRRLQDETARVLDGPAGYEDLPNLRFTQRIVNEALRLYPPGWLITRTVTVPTELDGHPLPAGTAVAVLPYALHHRADLYAHPERFDPDRWDDAPPRGAFLPFGAGARKCIGDQFGMVEATLVLAGIASRWWVERPACAEPQHRLGAVLTSRGVRIRLRSGGW